MRFIQALLALTIVSPLSVIAIAPPSVVAVVPAPAASSTPAPELTCITPSGTGTIECCDSVLLAETSSLLGLLSQLGIPLLSSIFPVGVTCSQVSVSEVHNVFLAYAFLSIFLCSSSVNHVQRHWLAAKTLTQHSVSHISQISTLIKSFPYP